MQRVWLDGRLDGSPGLELFLDASGKVLDVQRAGPRADRAGGGSARREELVRAAASAGGGAGAGAAPALAVGERGPLRGVPVPAGGAGGSAAGRGVVAVPRHWRRAAARRPGAPLGHFHRVDPRPPPRTRCSRRARRTGSRGATAASSTPTPSRTSRTCSSSAKDAVDLRYVRVNKAAERLGGLSRGELLGRDVLGVSPRAQLAEAFIRSDREVLEGGRPVDLPEVPIDTMSGVRWVHTRKIPPLRRGRPPRVPARHHPGHHRAQAGRGERCAWSPRSWRAPTRIWSSSPTWPRTISRSRCGRWPATRSCWRGATRASWTRTRTTSSASPWTGPRGCSGSSTGCWRTRARARAGRSRSCPCDARRWCRRRWLNLGAATAESGAEVTVEPLPEVRGDEVQLGAAVPEPHRQRHQVPRRARRSASTSGHGAAGVALLGAGQRHRHRAAVLPAPLRPLPAAAHPERVQRAPGSAWPSASASSSGTAGGSGWRARPMAARTSASRCAGPSRLSGSPAGRRAGAAAGRAAGRSAVELRLGNGRGDRLGGRLGRRMRRPLRLIATGPEYSRQQPRRQHSAETPGSSHGQPPPGSSQGPEVYRCMARAGRLALPGWSRAGPTRAAASATGVGAASDSCASSSRSPVGGQQVAAR